MNTSDLGYLVIKLIKTTFFLRNSVLCLVICEAEIDNHSRHIEQLITVSFSFYSAVVGVSTCSHLMGFT